MRARAAARRRDRRDAFDGIAGFSLSPSALVLLSPVCFNSTALQPCYPRAQNAAVLVVRAPARPSARARRLASAAQPGSSLRHRRTAVASNLSRAGNGEHGRLSASKAQAQQRRALSAALFPLLSQTPRSLADDVEVHFVRSGGAGGQNVNKGAQDDALSRLSHSHLISPLPLQ